MTRSTHRRPFAIVLGLTLPLLAGAALAAPACGDADYRVQQTPFLPVLDGDGTRDVVRLRDGVVTITGCAPTPARIRQRRDKVRLTARWTSCDALRGRVRLRMTIAADCGTARGTVAIGKRVRRFTAVAGAPAPGGGTTPPPGGEPRVIVDADLLPDVSSVPPVSGDGADAPRPVAAVVDDATGAKTQFVADEVVVYTSDAAALDAFLTRWNGTVLRTVSPAEYGLDGLSDEHLVRIDSSRADPARLGADLRGLNPDQAVALRVSSRTGLATLGAMIAETLAKQLPVGLNLVAEGQVLEDRQITDGVWAGPGAANPFADPTLQADCAVQSGPCVASGTTLAFGVTEAWRALDRAGRLGNRVALGILDGGFSAVGTNLPAGWTHLSTGAGDALETENPMACTAGSYCPWHGTNSAQVAAAVVGDGAGVAGTGGPVASLLTANVGTDISSARQGLMRLAAAGARIVSMSFGFTRTGVLAGLGSEFEEFQKTTRRLFDQGVLLLAAAGNNGAYVDSRGCDLLFCGENVHYFPCEADGVLCVGGLAANGLKHTSSNYGAEVELYAPYTLWTGPNPAGSRPGAQTAIRMSGGTSGSTPYVAGVAALVLAANPALRANEVHQILIETGRPGLDRDVARYVDAHAAVVRALGGPPPELFAVRATQQTTTGSLFGRPEVELAGDVTGDATATIEWSSDLAGALGRGNPLRPTLRRGRHVISGTAVDARGFRSRTLTTEVTVEYSLSAPSLRIVAPVTQSVFEPNQRVLLEVEGFDPYTVGNTLRSENVYWYDNGNPTPIARGLRTMARLGGTVGHLLTAVYYYDGGISSAQAAPVLAWTVDQGLDLPPQMYIGEPLANELVLHAGLDGIAHLAVQGMGFDAEDVDPILGQRPFTLYWMGDRGDLAGQPSMWFVPPDRQRITLDLRHDPRDGQCYTLHTLHLAGMDSAGNEGFSAPLRVAVFPYGALPSSICN